MGAGLASGLSRFGQVYGPAVARNIATRREIERTALENALRQKQTEQLSIENILKQLEVPGKRMDVADYTTPEARKQRAGVRAGAATEAAARASGAMRREELGTEFDRPNAQAELAGKVSANEGQTLANQGKNFRNILDQEFGRKEEEHKQTMDGLNEQVQTYNVQKMFASDPVESAKLDEKIKQAGLEAQQQMNKYNKSRAVYNAFKAAGGGSQAAGISTDERQTLNASKEALKGLTSVMTPNPVDPKKTPVSVPIISPGATQNIATQAMMLSRSGDRKKFDKVLSIQAKSLADKLFSDGRKVAQLGQELKNGIETSGWFTRERKIGDASGKTIPLGTTLPKYIAQKKAEFIQSFKDEMESIWSAGQQAGPGNKFDQNRFQQLMGQINSGDTEVEAEEAPDLSEEFDNSNVTPGDVRDFMAEQRSLNPQITVEELKALLAKQFPGIYK